MAVRLAGGFAGACVVVLSLSLFASWLIRLFEEREVEDTIVAHPVDLLSGYSSVDLNELMGEPRYQLPAFEPPPPLPIQPVATPERTINGFVMIEVDVDAQGHATAARVIDATPTGLYEQQAIEEALAAEYPAGNAGARDTLIRFSVPADETR